MCRSLSPSQVSDADMNSKRTVWKCHPHLWEISCSLCVCVGGGTKNPQPSKDRARTESPTSVKVVIGAVIMLVTVDAEGPQAD